MNRINAFNIYLGNKRKYLLITLNILLVIFVILEISILNIMNPEYLIETAGTEYCRTCGDKGGNFSKGW